MRCAEQLYPTVAHRSLVPVAEWQPVIRPQGRDVAYRALIFASDSEEVNSRCSATC